MSANDIPKPNVMGKIGAVVELDELRRMSMLCRGAMEANRTEGTNV